MHEVVEEAAAITRYGLKNRKVRIECSIVPNRPLHVEGFRNRLIQVVLNLINNAEQAIDLTGRAGTVTLHLEERAGMAALDIMDTGPGIPPGDRPRIFDAFFTTKERDKGTGMGLYLAREIVQDHGGELRLLCGDPGRTVFRLTLPLRASGEHRKAMEAGAL